jgi:hypothetical protein
MKNLILFLLVLSICFCFNSCKKKVKGCTDPSSLNYNPKATDNDGSCIPKVYGCMDYSSLNYNPAANVDNGACQYAGKVTFWYNTSGTQATVTIGGQTGNITMYYSDYTNVSCGTEGCANFTLPIGSYSYHASSTWSTWNGSVNITHGDCVTVLLQ